MSIRIFTLAMTMVGLCALSANAQQVTVGTPFNTVNDSFFERQGVGFGFSIPGGGVPNGRNSGVFGLRPDGTITPNVNFNQGGFNNAIPQFGGFDPNSTARAGAAVLSDEGNLFFNLDFGQGSTRSISSTTPSVTLTNGVPGNFTSTVQRPFVTSVTPVVNGFTGQPTRNIVVPQYQVRQPARRPSGPPAVTGMVSRLNAEGGFSRPKTFANDEPGIVRPEVELRPSDEVAAAGVSSAGQHVASIAEIQAQQQADTAANNSEAQALFDRGLAAEAAGKRSLAKHYFRIAAKQAEGELKTQAIAKMRQMQTTGSAGNR